MALDAARVADGATVGGLLVHRRRRAGRARARLAARPGDRRDAGAGRRHRGPHRRPCDQERRGVRPHQARARRLRDARGDRRGGAAAAPAAARGGDAGAAVSARRRPRSTPPGSSVARTSPRRWSGCPTRARCSCGSRARRRRCRSGSSGCGSCWGRRRLGERRGRRGPVGRARRLTRGTLDDAVLRIGVRPSRLPGVLAGLDTRGGHGRARHRRRHRRAARRPGRRRRGPRRRARRGRDLGAAQPPGRAATLPAWGPAPSALAVLRAVKQELDPAGRLGPGRLAPWLTEGHS